MTDKLLHNLQLSVISGLETTGVMENITAVTRKGEFELDIMLATLHKQDRHDQPSPIRTRQPNLHRRLELNLDRRLLRSKVSLRVRTYTFASS
jgi:hypothetical protein